MFRLNTSETAVPFTNKSLRTCLVSRSMQIARQILCISRQFFAEILYVFQEKLTKKYAKYAAQDACWEILNGLLVMRIQVRIAEIFNWGSNIKCPNATQSRRIRFQKARICRMANTAPFPLCTRSETNELCTAEILKFFQIRALILPFDAIYQKMIFDISIIHFTSSVYCVKILTRQKKR